jgi:hypothetical protein
MILGGKVGGSGSSSASEPSPTPTHSATATTRGTPTPPTTPTWTTAPTAKATGGVTDTTTSDDGEIVNEGDAGSAAGAVTETAAGFVQLWARPDVDAITWREGIRPITTASAYESLAAIDPATLAPVQISGDPIVRSLTDTTATVDVPTTGVTVRVGMTLIDGSWLVSSVETP